MCVQPFYFEHTELKAAVKLMYMRWDTNTYCTNNLTLQGRLSDLALRVEEGLINGLIVSSADIFSIYFFKLNSRVTMYAIVQIPCGSYRLTT